MAIVPNDTRFIGISPSVDLTERKSDSANSKTEPYTMQDIADSAGGGAQTVLSGLIAQGTSDSTTSVMEYAVNVFTTSTSSDYATKLPQPTTGKTTKIINMSSSLISVYPSNVGGKINNLDIDEPILIPNDGKVYEFICTLNPLPGNWNTITSPATGQKVFAEIEIPHTNGVETSVNGFDTIAMTTGIPSITYGGSAGNITLIGNHLTEPTPTTLVKTKIYTNVLDTDLTVAPVFFGMRTNHRTITPGLQTYTTSYLNFGLGEGIQSPLSTLNSPAEVGDTGTFYREDAPNWSVRFPQIGAQDANSASPYYYFFLFLIPASAATKTYKFKIILEIL